MTAKPNDKTTSEKLMEILSKMCIKYNKSNSLDEVFKTIDQAHDQIIKLWKRCLPEKVWVVGIGDCEGNEIVAVCSTKELAEKKLFETRDKLIAEWKEADICNQASIVKFCQEKNKKVWEDTMYKDMITSLQGNDYEKWNNFPHDCPYLYETELITEAEKNMEAL